MRKKKIFWKIFYKLATNGMKELDFKFIKQCQKKWEKKTNFTYIAKQKVTMSYDWASSDEFMCADNVKNAS